MGYNWRKLHPQYDDQLKAQATLLVVRKKLLAERDALDENIENDPDNATTSAMLRLQLWTRLENISIDLNGISHNMGRILQKLRELKQQPPYEGYENDFAANIQALHQRHTRYIRELSPLELQKPEKHSPDTWFLDSSGINLKPYRPIITGVYDVSSNATNNATNNAGAPDLIGIPRRHHKVRFRYADNNKPVANRVVLYWKYKKNEKGVEEIAYDERWLSAPVSIARTDGAGYIVQTANTFTVRVQSRQEPNTKKQHYRINILGTSCVKGERMQEKDYYDICSINDTPPYAKNDLEKQKTNEWTDINAIAPLTGSEFDPTAEYAFFLYPPDAGEVVTKCLDELVNNKTVFSYNNYTDLPIVYKGKLPENGIDIALHCTLPEWTYRLGQQLARLQHWINVLEILKQPHLAKLQNVTQLCKVADLNARYGIGVNDPDEFARRKKLLEDLEKLETGLSIFINNPTTDYPITKNMGEVRNNLYKEAKALWRLMNLEGFRAELKHYLDYMKENISTDYYLKGRPGPYMESEYHWEKIFVTLSECYAGLSQSGMEGDVWQQDIEVMLDRFVNDERLNEYGKQWLAYVNTNPEYNYDFGQDKLFQSQLNSINKPIPIKKKNTVLSSVIDWYLDILPLYEEAKIQETIGAIVPTPGPPCLLQVALDSYGALLSKKAIKTGAVNPVYHLRINIFVGRTLGMYHKSYESRYFNAYTIAFLTKHGSPHVYAKLAKSQIKQFFSEWDFAIDGEGTKSREFYQSIKGRGALMGRTVFTLLNLSLAWQNFLRADAEPENTVAFLSAHDLLSDASQLGSAGTSTIASMLVANRVYNVLILKQPDYESGKLVKWAGQNLDKVATGLLFISAAVSLADIAALIESGNTDDVAKKSFELSVELTTASGYVLRMLSRTGARFAAREAAMAGVNVLPGVGQFAFVVGSGISIIMLAWDLFEVVSDTVFYELFASEPKKLFHDKWRQFQAPINIDKVTLPPSMDAYSLKALMEKAPFKQYDDRSTQRNSDKSSDLGFLVKQPIADIRDVVEAQFFNVEWKMLSWQAVIPLYLAGLEVASIIKIIEMPHQTKKAKLGQIRGVRDIIQYYDDVAKSMPERHDEQTYQAYLARKAIQLSPFVVARLLREGNFRPRMQLEYKDKNRWIPLMV